MTASNRTQVSTVREVTIGTTPPTPRMRAARFTSVDPNLVKTYVSLDEIRSDRMTGDDELVMSEANTQIGGELYYPAVDDPLAMFIESLMWNLWTNTPSFFNDGTADSVITDAGTTANTYAVVSGGTAVVAGMLVRATGFTNAANNQVFRAASSTAATIVGAGLTLTAEAVPPGTARLKVVGFQGASGDVTAAAGGLTSTALNFTTLGIVPGMWLRIGGSAVGDKFATAANNEWVRCSGTPTATSLPLDNLPTGWAVDAGTGKTIKVWFGDRIKNGGTKLGQSIEVGYLGQVTPSYFLNKGQVVDTGTFSVASRGKATFQLNFSGLSQVASTTTVDAVVDAAATSGVYTANAGVARLSENGTKLVAPNCAKEMSITINNNMRKSECLDDDFPLDLLEGECTVTGTLNTYFGSLATFNKYANNLPTSFSKIYEKTTQQTALVFEIPRAKLTQSSMPVQGKNQDVMANYSFKASIDTLTQCHIFVNRLEYIEIA